MDAKTEQVIARPGRSTGDEESGDHSQGTGTFHQTASEPARCRRELIVLDRTPYVDPETAGGSSENRRAGEWENALGRPLNYRQVLTDEERALFLSETQRNVYLQTSPHAKPYSSGRWNNKEADAAKLRAITKQYGDGKAPFVFTEKKVRDDYEPDFLEADLASGFDHSGNLRGSNEYGSVRFAVQLGSAHHGDHELRRRAAWLGAAVEPEGKGTDRDYGDVGGGVLWQMCEAQVAQSALRVGRDGSGARVCLDTVAFLTWLPVENPDASGDVSLWGATERRVHEFLRVQSLRTFSSSKRLNTIPLDSTSPFTGSMSICSPSWVPRPRLGELP